MVRKWYSAHQLVISEIPAIGYSKRAQCTYKKVRYTPQSPNSGRVPVNLLLAKFLILVGFGSESRHVQFLEIRAISDLEDSIIKRWYGTTKFVVASATI